MWGNFVRNDQISQHIDPRFKSWTVIIIIDLFVCFHWLSVRLHGEKLHLFVQGIPYLLFESVLTLCLQVTHDLLL